MHPVIIRQLAADHIREVHAQAAERGAEGLFVRVREAGCPCMGHDLAEHRHTGPGERFWARRLAMAARSRNPGDGGTHPACLAMARSSRLAQCSAIMPSRVRNQWVCDTANSFPVGGMTVSTVSVPGR